MIGQGAVTPDPEALAGVVRPAIVLPRPGRAVDDVKLSKKGRSALRRPLQATAWPLFRAVPGAFDGFIFCQGCRWERSPLVSDWSDRRRAALSPREGTRPSSARPVRGRRSQGGAIRMVNQSPSIGQVLRGALRPWREVTGGRYQAGSYSPSIIQMSLSRDSTATASRVPSGEEAASRKRVRVVSHRVTVRPARSAWRRMAPGSRPMTKRPSPPAVPP